ncbi:MAG: ABC transporter substrate-binding protein [Chloroflexi bacterium]|nr:ABC transporter substrate-binding protein [Chloroflexota bacterium]
MVHRIAGWSTGSLFTLALLACAPAPPAPAAAPAPPAPAAPAPAQPAAETPKQGGVFAYPGQTMGQSLNPHQFGAVSERYVPGPVFETFIHYKGGLTDDYRVDFAVEPWLAERWETPDDTTFRFHVRPGVRWHDGTEFTADDVAYTYNALLDPKNAYPLRNRLDGVKEIRAVDRATLEIVTGGPAPNLLANLADYNMMIMPKHVHDRGDDLSKVAIGTGPMKLKNYDRQKGASWVRNPDYWLKGTPQVDGMEFYLMPEPGSRTAALIGKAVDTRAPTDRAQVDDLKGRIPGLGVGVVMTDYGNSLVMKLDKPPFNDKRVRRAIHLAIDRQALLKVASFGEGVISLPGMPGHKTGWALPQEEWQKLPRFRQPKDQDLAEARRLMAEAGFPNGVKATVLYPSSKSATPKIIEPLAGQLKATGAFEMLLDGRPQADTLRMYREGSFDAFFDGAADMALKNQREYIHSKGPNNKYGLNDPRVDQAIDTWFRVMDLGKRQAAAQELQRIMLEENYIISSIDLPGYQVWHPWVKNFRYNKGISELIDARAIAELWLDVDQMPADRRKGQ